MANQISFNGLCSQCVFSNSEVASLDISTHWSLARLCSKLSVKYKNEFSSLGEHKEMFKSAQKKSIWIRFHLNEPLKNCRLGN